MKRACAIRRAGDWLPEAASDEIVLDYDHRHRRRLRFTAGSGADILLDLQEAIHLRDGDALLLEDGGLIAIRAEAEKLLEIRAGDADTLARLAWHLGNRHLAVQFLPGRLRILDDRVIAEMILGLGGAVTQLTAPFDPESGAYAHG